MKGIEIIPKETFRTTEWSGGTTTELYIWPEGSSYAERRFNVRISSAEVRLEESVFTSLPGVKRYLTPLCKGFRLTINGEEVELPNGRVLEFSGSDEVSCCGSGRDLNLMLKGCEGEMKLVAGEFRVMAPMAFLYAVEESVLAPAGEKLCEGLKIEAGAFLRLAPGGYTVTESAVLFLARP